MTKNKLLMYYLSLFAAFYVATVIIGIYNNYSPVPHWDMWNGYLDFYTKVQNNDWYVWVGQHNEHRIFLSRILFWIDIHFFDGTVYFLLICNFLLLVGIAYIFYRYISKLFLNEKYNLKVMLSFTVTILIFSWIQKENMNWGFQSQFFLAYLVPLVSFYLFAIHCEKEKIFFFLFAILMGILSVFTMANGVIVLPLLIVFGFIVRLSKHKQAILIIITILTLYLHFLNYVSRAEHGSLSNELINHTKLFFTYILTYLGAPFVKIFESSELLIAQFFGLIFIVSSIYFTYLAFKRKEIAFVFALLIFISYIGATAFGTAGGRAFLGLNQALSSRYMTPVLMGWSTLLILFVYFNNNLKVKKFIKILFFMVPLLFLYEQIKTLKYHSDIERKLASVALELSIKDTKYLQRLFSSHDRLMAIANRAKEKNISIFGNKLVSDISLKINTHYGTIPNNNLIGYLDKIQSINGEYKYNRVIGWIFDEETHTIPKSAFLTDEKGVIVGYVITHFSRLDVKEKIDVKAEFSGFVGYILKSYQRKILYIVSQEYNKKLKVTFKTPLFSHENKYNKNLVTDKQILSSSYKENKTYNNKILDKIKIYGSFIDGDKTQASIKIKLKKYDNLLYKTGPRSNGQLINIYENNQLIYSGQLLISNEWRLLSFNTNKKNLIVEIIDNSSLWGEWSAVALKVENESK